MPVCLSANARGKFEDVRKWHIVASALMTSSSSLLWVLLGFSTLLLFGAKNRVIWPHSGCDLCDSEFTCFFMSCWPPCGHVQSTNASCTLSRMRTRHLSLTKLCVQSLRCTTFGISEGTSFSSLAGPTLAARLRFQNRQFHVFSPSRHASCCRTPSWADESFSLMR